jgi:hypothetical protein
VTLILVASMRCTQITVLVLGAGTYAILCTFIHVHELPPPPSTYLVITRCSLKLPSRDSISELLQTCFLSSSEHEKCFLSKSMSKKLRKSDANAFETSNKFKVLLKLHPRIPKNDLPSVLTDYIVVHFSGGEQLTHDVARLYFLTFVPDKVDRNMVFPSLRLGETLAVLTPDRKSAVTALTSVECSGEVVILFLASLPLFQSTGMG